jgi:CubicO group peptidase (beta-lactamase class C family)
MTNRRQLLQLGAAAAGVGFQPVFGEQLPTTITRATAGIYSPLLDEIAAYAALELQTVGLPGIIIGLTDKSGFEATVSVGWSNIDTREPLAAEQLFQIGSITKGFTGLCVHALAGEGKIDLDSKASSYLPEVPWPDANITVIQILNHSSGLPRAAALFPNVPDKKLWLGNQPGRQVQYSNLGFEILGEIISKVSGQPYSAFLKERIFAPLGMTGAKPYITLSDRWKYPTGYVPAQENYPPLSRSRLVQGEFDEMSVASGSIAATSADMCKYLRFVLKMGSGHAEPILSATGAKQLLERDVAADIFVKGDRYASGFGKVNIGGITCLHHTGSVDLFSSSYHADPETGVACFASANGRLLAYRPTNITAYAIELMRAARKSTSMPARPSLKDFRAIKNPENLAGKYLSASNSSFEIQVSDDRGVIFSNGQYGRIEQDGHLTFVTDHPHYREHAFELLVGLDEKIQLWWGEELFEKGGVPLAPKPDTSLLPLRGIYCNGRPEFREVILVRGDQLIHEGVGPMRKHQDGYWVAVNDPGGYKRLWFTNWINGRPRTLNYYGRISNRFE